MDTETAPVVDHGDDEIETEVVHTNCRACGHAGCGVYVTLENGKAVNIRGDMDHPISKGYLCRKARGFIADLQYHKDRLLYPRKRVGERGEASGKESAGTKPWAPLPKNSTGSKRRTDRNQSSSGMAAEVAIIALYTGSQICSARPMCWRTAMSVTCREWLYPSNWACRFPSWIMIITPSASCPGAATR